MTPRELVLAQFPGRITIGLIDAGAAIGLAEQTCYNMHHKGTFPLRTIIQNRKPMVALTELIRYLEAREPQSPSSQTAAQPKRGRGRPRNSDREAA